MKKLNYFLIKPPGTIVQKKNENIWRFYQNDIINNEKIKLFSDKTSMNYRSQQKNENIWSFHQNDVINNEKTKLISDKNEIQTNLDHNVSVCFSK